MAKRNQATEKNQAMLEAIARSVSQQPATQPETPTPTEAPAPEASDQSQSKGNTGKASLLWFHPEDKMRIAELRAFLASQGRSRINDSLIIKTALRAVHTDEALLAAYDEALQSDRRLKKHKTPQ